jgi:hypothetical protein
MRIKPRTGQKRGQSHNSERKKAPGMEKVHLLIDVLKSRDLSEIYILPSLREMLDKEKER